MGINIGLDIGAISLKLAALGRPEDREILEKLCGEGRPFRMVDGEMPLALSDYRRIAGSPIQSTYDLLHEFYDVVPEARVEGIRVTGSGSRTIARILGLYFENEFKAIARMIAEFYPRARTVFEIGGESSKYIRLEKQSILDYDRSGECAAGTGSFLEEQAEKLGISIKDEFASLALASTKPARLGERCTVFMERDVSSLLMKGAEVGDLAAGLAYSVALNYLNRVVRGRKIGDAIFFQGGTAYNDSVAAAFSQILGKRIIVPPHNGVIGAIGMALIAQEVMQQRGRPASKFRGYHLDRVDYKTREFVCKACSNFCDIKEFNIEGERTYWGDKCSDKFRKRARTDRKPVVDDLIEYRDKILEQVLKPPAGNRKKVGIPRTMFFYDRFPFWCAYIQELGFEVVVSPRTDPVIATSGDELAVAQPCFPVKVAHGHVHKLLDSGVDYVLLPNTLNEYSEQRAEESHLCPWNQTLPFVVRAIPQMEAAREKFLVPTVNFRYGRKHVEKELAEFAKTLAISRRMSDRAVTAAYAAQGAFTDQILEAGAHALDALERTGEPALVLVGRSYNLYDRSINCDIPRKLRVQYGANVIPMDFLALEKEDIREVNPNMYWNSGRRILAAARITRRRRNLHLVYISNFKCGPDSYIKSFMNEAAGKPGLMLQFDGHSNDAGFITRCEAYLDSKGFLRCSATAT